MISRALVCILIICSLGCSLPWRVPKVMAATEAAAAGTRFLVLPVNALVPVAPELSGSTGRILSRIIQYLGLQGFERGFVDEFDTRRLWRESVAEVEASADLPRDFRSAMRLFSRKLAESSSYDALVVPSLVYRQAMLVRGMVKWDGVTRRLPKPEEPEGRVPESYQGEVSAVSLHVIVFDPSGELVFEDFGGLDVAHLFSAEPGPEGGLIATLREPILGQERYLNEGVELAFEPYLPRPRSSSW